MYPYLTVRDENPEMETSTTAVTEYVPKEGTLRVYEMPGGALLEENRDYVMLAPDRLELLEPVTGNSYLSVDYRYNGDVTGPYEFREDYATANAVPGTVLAFGRMAEQGDQFAVVVFPKREQAYKVFGGRWELSLEMDIWARDHRTQMEITDRTAIFVWGVLKSYLGTQGIEIMDFTIGGESEEMYDEGGGDYFYNSNLSITLSTEWEIHVPVGPAIRSYEERFRQNLDMPHIEDPLDGIPDIEYFTDPFFQDSKTGTFEMMR